MSYLVIYSDAVKLPLSQWSSRGVKGLRATLKALSRDTKYWIRVAAETLVGTGNYSSPIFVKTLKYDRKSKTPTLLPNESSVQAISFLWVRESGTHTLPAFYIEAVGTKVQTGLWS